MPDPRKDQIAREAARLIESGRASSIPDAVRLAADALGLQHVEPPGAGRVRKHAEAIALQALGDRGYAERVQGVLRAAERLMTVLHEGLADARTLLVGRAARGKIDAGVTVHIRLYTTASVTDVAATVVEFGYDEPEFATVNTRVGRLNRVLVVDDGQECAITRCAPVLYAKAATDLFTGKPIATLGLDQLRQMIADS